VVAEFPALRQQLDMAAVQHIKTAIGKYNFISHSTPVMES
jgi:hypothetical protein